MGVDGKLHVPEDLITGMTPYPFHRRLSWNQTVWLGAENDASTAMRSPDQKGISTSLYPLRYPGSNYNIE